MFVPLTYVTSVGGCSRSDVLTQKIVTGFFNLSMTGFLGINTSSVCWNVMVGPPSLSRVGVHSPKVGKFFRPMCLKKQG